MNDNENRKAPQELTDEMLDAVAGGGRQADSSDAYFWQQFRNNNDCLHCKNSCPYIFMSPEERSITFGRDPNAKCQYYKNM